MTHPRSRRGARSMRPRTYLRRPASHCKPRQTPTRNLHRRKSPRNDAVGRPLSYGFSAAGGGRSCILRPVLLAHPPHPEGQGDPLHRFVGGLAPTALLSAYGEDSPFGGGPICRLRGGQNLRHLSRHQRQRGVFFENGLGGRAHTKNTPASLRHGSSHSGQQSLLRDFMKTTRSQSLGRRSQSLIFC